MPYKKVAHHCLFKIVVDPKHQRKGIGRALLKNLKHLAKTYFHLELMHIEVFEGAACGAHAGIHRRTCHRGRNPRDQPRVEGVGDDVFRPEISHGCPFDAVCTSSGTSSRARLASASAAATFIASLMVGARTSSAPRKM